MMRWRSIALLLACALPVHAVELVPAYETLQLDNGATVLLLRRADVPLVAADVIVRGGALADADGREGSAALFAEMLNKGAGERDARAFSEAIEGVGGQLGFSADRDALRASASFMAKDAELMLDLIADALLRPKLDAAEFEKLRSRAIDSLAAAKDGDVRTLIDSYADAWLFRGHPYGRAISGDERSLAAITLDDLKAFDAQQVGADRLILALVGDFDVPRMRQLVKARFSTWRRAAGSEPRVVAKPPETQPRVLLVDKPGSAQTYFWIGNVGVDESDAQRAAHDLVTTVFGGRFTSMLNTELRIKSGLSYSASAALDRQARPGSAAFTSYTRRDATAEAIALAYATLARLHAEGIDAATLKSAQQYVRGQFAPNFETAEQLASALAQLTLNGQQRDRYNGYADRAAAVTAAELAAARSVFAVGGRSLLVVIGDAASIRKAVAKYGPLTEMKITDPGFSPAPAH